MSVWDYFKPSQRPHDAGLRIIELLQQAPRQSETIYLARMNCCGSLRKFTHEAIRKRQHKQSASCVDCSKQKEQREKIEELRSEGLSLVPTWPVPPLVLAMKGHWVWGDRG